MTVYNDFFSQYTEMLDHQDMSPEIIAKYESILPRPIIDIWKKHGLGGYADGLFWTINPDKYLEYINKWVIMDYDAIYPIMRTAFGDLVIIYNLSKDDNEYKKVRTAVIDTKYHDADTITISLESFFKNYLLVPGRFFAATKIKSTLFYQAFNNFGVLKYDQCYGYEPILPLGGKEDIKNIKIVNFDVHLDILTQTLKEPLEL